MAGTQPLKRGTSPKAERTRARILEAALELFAQRGYEETTMRAVAESAGVSTGNAYYYFESKEHLVHGFYAQSHVAHLEACEPLLGETDAFRERLHAVLRTKLDTTEPYHRFSGQLFKTAADPASPLSPFSDDSSPVRQECIALMERVIDGSKLKVPADLRAELPYLLWMHLMGIVLFWIHDRSPGRRRSYRMAQRTAEIVARLVALASNPLMKPVRGSALRLLEELRHDAATPEDEDSLRP